MGGTSNEREVSLVSGRNVAEALASLGTLEVIPVVLDHDNLNTLPAGIDACYVTLHGGWGESGGVQAALDARGIPYTGPGAASCRLTMDKIATKRTLDAAGVPTAPWAVVADPAAACPLPFPCVAKPPCDGSSVGISRVPDASAWPAALSLALEPNGRLPAVRATGHCHLHLVMHTLRWTSLPICQQRFPPTLAVGAIPQHPALLSPITYPLAPI